MTVSIVRQSIKFRQKSRCITDLLSSGKRLLACKKIDSPALDAALLLAEVSGLSHEELITHSDHELDEKQSKRYFELLERRNKGECIAYILGKKEFWGLEFFVSPAVLVPRPDTEILVETALSILRPIPRSDPYSPLPPNSPLILDLCTGSGNVAIALKHECPNIEVWAADVSKDALNTARKNAKSLNCEITFLQGDLFGAVKNQKPKTDTHTSCNKKPLFFLITANAPYVPSADIALLPPEVQNEPRLALDGGQDGLDLIRRIAGEAPKFLEPGGCLILEADPSQMETIAAMLKNNGFAKLVLYRDFAGEKRVIAAFTQN